MRSPRTGAGVVATLVATLIACDKMNSTAPEAGALSTPRPSAAVATTGNGFPSGAHYNLNIIGVPKGKSAAMTGGSGHRIFVNLEGTSRINLSRGDFQVLDANGTDGTAAFRLPNPDSDGDGTTTYSVFARALGKPGTLESPNSSTTTACYTDAQTAEKYCSIYQMVLVRDKGKSSATNVSRDLLYVYSYQDTDNDPATAPVLVRTGLFADALDAYYWNYDNSGLKLAQLRFYETPTTVPAQ